MQTFHCDHCGHLVYFENVRCDACGHALGYLTDLRTMGALVPAQDGLWHRAVADGNPSSLPDVPQLFGAQRLQLDACRA